MKPLHLVIEGPDATGKGTLIDNLIKDWRWGKVDRYFDPGISDRPEHVKWQELRSFIKNEKMNSLTETLMFFALRSELLSNVENSLKNGVHVIQDRGDVSTSVYQGFCKGQSVFIQNFELVCKLKQPDLIFILFAPFEILSERLLKRNANIDKFKSSESFRKKSWEGYKWFIDTQTKDCSKYHVIDASGTEEQIKHRCLEIIKYHVS